MSEKNEELRNARSSSVSIIAGLLFVLIVVATFGYGVIYAISIGKELGYERGYREAVEKCRK